MHMRAVKPIPWLRILLSLMAALFLEMLSLPEFMNPYWPHWLVLVLVFWSLYLPQSLPIGVAWFAGLLLDILQFGLLGQNAFGMTLLIFIVRLFHSKIRNYFAWKQMIIVFILCVIDSGFEFLINSMQVPLGLQWQPWSACLVSMACWIPLYILLRRSRSHKRG